MRLHKVSLLAVLAAAATLFLSAGVACDSPPTSPNFVPDSSEGSSPEQRQVVPRDGAEVAVILSSLRRANAPG